MSRYVLALLCVLLPVKAIADPAPLECAFHFARAEMPRVAPHRMASARLLCFSAYAVLHSGLSKTPVWSAEHLTAGSIDAAAPISKNRPNNSHAQTRRPIDERAELADYKGSGFDRGHMSPSGDMPTR